MRLFSRSVVQSLVLFLSLSWSIQGIEHSPFVIWSPPKCGTHLFTKVLSSITGREPAMWLTPFELTDEQVVNFCEAHTAQSRFVVAHCLNANIAKALIEGGYKMIFVLRDPRDQLVSAYYYIQAGHWWWLRLPAPVTQEQEIEDLITGAIKGCQMTGNLFLPWEQMSRLLPPSGIYYGRFEKLVGEQGGGSTADQVEEVLALATHIGAILTIEEAEAIAAKSFGETTTFRTGRIGGWKTVFTERHKELYKRLFNQHLIRLGYVNGWDW